ncbi:CG16756 [Drosophila busckii]|uniref:lysozyme n=1 Tax=Drosophila busckii TaxID=30019 RepID=A0A0M4F9L1_DROBS|nr:CG16756 [Drosophila busckii]
MRTQSLALLSLSLWVIIISSSFDAVLSKRYMRCELARKLLQQHGFERSLLPVWICLLEHESDLDTAKITANPNGSSSYGLFQINTRYCQQDRRGGVCNIKCEGKFKPPSQSKPKSIICLRFADLLDENLRESASCAKRIQTSEGFRHWNGWQRYCRNTQNLPNLKVICGI